MEAIYKTPHGKHIDLSKLVSVSDAYFIDRMGSGGFFVGFDMQFQLIDGLTVHQEEVFFDQYEVSTFGFQHKVMSVGGEMVDRDELPESEIKAVHELQVKVNQIIKAWKSFKADGDTP